MTATTRIIQSIREGEVVLLPTDTVYGLLADPRSPRAMKHLFELKQRPDGVPVAVLVASFDQAFAITERNARFGELADAHWPGALTLIAEVAPEQDFHLNSGTTIGVRFPDHDLIRSIASEFGPVAATSANLHGEPTITDPKDAKRVFGADVDVIVDGGVLGDVASTVVDTTVEPAAILRQGEIRI